MRTHLIIGTRGSALALRQAELVRARLAEHYPHLSFTLKIIRTSGDRILDRPRSPADQQIGWSIPPLAEVGGKGLFIKELEDALQRQEIDMAVHSLKDMTAELPEGLHLAAILKREDPRDALVTRTGEGTLHTLPHGAVVGTSSLRRSLQLRARRPDVQVRPLRGNVDTRLRKLDEGHYDAIILATAGLVRLGLADRIAERIAIEVMIPGIGQGAIAVETRASDQWVNMLLRPLDHLPTRWATMAERAFLQRLGGSCHVPIAAHAEILTESGAPRRDVQASQDPKDPGDTPGASPAADREVGRTSLQMRLRGWIASPDGRHTLSAEVTGPLSEALALGHRLAEHLIAQGALALLERSEGRPKIP